MLGLCWVCVGSLVGIDGVGLVCVGSCWFSLVSFGVLGELCVGLLVGFLVGLLIWLLIGFLVGSLVGFLFGLWIGFLILGY